MMAEPAYSQSIRIERHGDIAVITPSPEVEKMPENLMEQAAMMVLAPLRSDPPAGLIFDLSRVDYVGSVFLSFLLRCHKRVKEHGSEVVVAGASHRARGEAPATTTSLPCSLTRLWQRSRNDRNTEPT